MFVSKKKPKIKFFLTRNHSILCMALLAIRCGSVRCGWMNCTSKPWTGNAVSLSVMFQWHTMKKWCENKPKTHTHTHTSYLMNMYTYNTWINSSWNDVNKKKVECNDRGFYIKRLLHFDTHSLNWLSLPLSCSLSFKRNITDSITLLFLFFFCFSTLLFS